MKFRVHHAAISVADMAEACAFYGLFGFKIALEYRQPDGSLEIAHLKLGDTLLEIFCYQEHVAAPASSADLATDLPRVGVKHLALQTSSIEDAKRFVETAGIAPLMDVQEGRTGIRYFFVKDPSGNLLELVEDNRDLSV